jgi:hypothetical protein
MSIKKAFLAQFARFFNPLCNMDRECRLAGEVRANGAPTISSNKSNGNSAPVALSSQDRHSSPVVTAQELERYYAKPGEAVWGC